MNKQNYTSLELSKKLAEAGCKLESTAYYNVKTGKLTKQKTRKEYTHYLDESSNDQEQVNIYDNIPAYDILNDICVKYADEMFTSNEEKEYYHHPRCIFQLMQKGLKQEAEDYIWSNCKFNPKNK